MKVARPPLRPRAVLVVVLGGPVALSACAMEEVLPAPSCVDGDNLLLTAQSVPSGDLVPCFEPLPAGWEATSVDIGQDGTVVRFDSDRAGEGSAVFHYVAACEIRDAVSAPSEFERAERYEDVERVDPSFRSRRFYIFDGGCAWWDFDFDEGATAALSIELGDRLQLVSRVDLNESIRDTFVDEEI